MVLGFEMRLSECELQSMIARERIMKQLRESDFMSMIFLNQDSGKKISIDKSRSETPS